MGSSSSSEAFDYDSQLLADRATYSVESKAEAKPDNATLPRRHPLAEHGLVDKPFGVDNIWDQFQLGVKKAPNNNCFGTRVWEYEEAKDGGKPKPKGRGAYKWLTYGQVDERARNVARGLLELGIPVASNIGIFSINRAEWCITALGLYATKYRTVALYDTLGDAAVEYIINHAELPVVFCSKDTVGKVLKSLEQFKYVKYIVQFDASDDFENPHEVVEQSSVDVAKKFGVELIGFSELLKKGAASDKSLHHPSGEDLALIMYTSGTTGMPKGVLLSHAGLAAPGGGLPGMDISASDSYLSFLPLAHIFETIVQAFLWANAASIGFFQGDPKKLPVDLNDIKPTVIAAVPRVYQRMYQKVFDGVSEKSFIKRFVFGMAYNQQANAIRNGTRIPRWDEKIFSNVKGLMGMSKARYLISGGAPCPSYLLEFLKVATGATVIQGYGLTETSAALTAVAVNDRTIGHTGAPLPWAEIRLKSVDEMGYSANANPPCGEVQVRGVGVFKGYYKNEEATRDATDDGWFCTGDIGRFNPNGTLSIIDRKKNIFKLAHGEYIAVEKVEAAYSKCTLLSQVWVYGNSFKPLLVGVAVPSADGVYRYAHEKGMWTAQSKPGSPTFIEDFKKFFSQHKTVISAHLNEELKKYEHELKGFEKVAAWHYETDINELFISFTVENDCLTPTFKLKRNNLLQKYIDPVKQMYTDLGEAPKPEERWLPSK